VIVDKPLWDDVQAVLAANRVERATGARASHPSLLTGMVFDETGERLTPTYAVKKGTRYRYYISTSLLTGAGRNRSHHIQARLIQNPKLTVHDIAREEQVSAAYLYTLLRLPWLAPDITTAIINGRKPPQLTAQTLMRLTPRLPAGWAEQRKLLGFR
jgi:hypothetical protein